MRSENGVASDEKAGTTDRRPTVLTLLAASAGPTSYRIDQLAEFGWDPVWPTRRPPHQRAAPVVRAVERATVPWHSAWVAREQIRQADAVLSMFESDGNGYAAWRALGRGGPPHVMIVCWLTEILRSATPRRLTAYRRLYEAVDHLVVLSSNQVAVLSDLLDRDPATIHAVRFGADLDALGDPTQPSGRTGSDATVLAVGRDAGRDWATLAAAVRGRPFTVDVVTRPELIEHIERPANMVAVGPTSFPEYVARLRNADVVVVPSHDRGYPTGQTVMLEAMAVGAACVVTSTAAMSDYIRPGIDCLTVPPGDPDALGDAIESLVGSPERRAALGTAAANDRDRLGSAQLWESVARILSAATNQQTRA